MNHGQVQSIHTGVFSILLNFEMDVLVKKENPPGTSFGPSGPQLGNQGGVDFIMVTKTKDDRK